MCSFLASHVLRNMFSDAVGKLGHDGSGGDLAKVVSVVVASAIRAASRFQTPDFRCLVR